ncbi:hypothetical protein CEXT_379941 [Caerostris extrusa]|uniref:Uncharacterized protein n=1 Tax=Caerostris extrusa TaxID=172846 RepID=A0AAV4VIQ6_CAEEX|nr:hypothetical protein CEXT_379941 [Caerostris extrusa]
MDDTEDKEEFDTSETNEPTEILENQISNNISDNGSSRLNEYDQEILQGISVESSENLNKSYHTMHTACDPNVTLKSHAVKNLGSTESTSKSTMGNYQSDNGHVYLSMENARKRLLKAKGNSVDNSKNFPVLEEVESYHRLVMTPPSSKLISQCIKTPLLSLMNVNDSAIKHNIAHHVSPSITKSKPMTNISFLQSAENTLQTLDSSYYSSNDIPFLEDSINNSTSESRHLTEPRILEERLLMT